MEEDQRRYREKSPRPSIPRTPCPLMEFRRSIVPTPSFSRSSPIERDNHSQLYHSDTLQMSHPFKDPIQPANFGSGKCPISKNVWTITTTEDGQEIIEEEHLTRLTEDTIFSLSDTRPGQSLLMDVDGNYTLKESSMKINFHSQRLC